MAYVKYNTVGELIDILLTLPRDTKIVHYESNCEKSGYTDNNYMLTETRKFKEETGYATDAFDGEQYTYKALRNVIRDNEDYDFEAIEI